MDVKHTGNVGGMLLYAKTDEEILPDGNVTIDGNMIAAKTLDLNVDFRLIEEQLNGIVQEFFGVDGMAR
jgi:5-methylcytosine-specific restriction enzyme subunit McrC